MQSQDCMAIQYVIADEIFQSSIALIKLEELVTLEPIHLGWIAIACA